MVSFLQVFAFKTKVFLKKVVFYGFSSPFWR
nr:MAG TPA: hypothetical protein [Bacteriophage sp.]